MLPEQSQFTPEQILRLERNPNLYARLGLEPGATAAEIDEAAGKRIEILHPDRHHGKPNRADYERATALIVAARDTLTNEHSYLKWCAQHGIPLDKFPPPPRRAEVVTSLEGESMPGGLSASVLSEDPHLHYDVEFMIGKMPDVLAAKSLYLTTLFGFHPDRLESGFSFESDERCLRAARHPRFRPHIEPILQRALGDSDSLDQVRGISSIFDICPKDYPEAFGKTIARRLNAAKPETAEDLLDLLYWVRIEASEIFARPNILDELRTCSSRLAVQDQAFVGEAIKLVVNMPLSPEDLFVRVFSLAKAREDFEFSAKCLVDIPNVDEFLRASSDPSILAKIISNIDSPSSLLHWKASGISVEMLSKALVILLPDLLRPTARAAKLGNAASPLLSITIDGKQTEPVKFNRALLTPELSAALDEYLQINIAKTAAAGNNTAPRTLANLIQLFGCPEAEEHIFARAMQLLFPPVSSNAAKAFLNVLGSFPEILANKTVLDAIASRPRRFAKFTEQRLQELLAKHQSQAESVEQDDSTS